MGKDKSSKTIKRPKVETSIDINRKKPEIDYPVFCFKHFQKENLKNCSQEQLRSFFERLQRLGELGWKEIQSSGKHDYGFELLPRDLIKPQLPLFVTPDVEKFWVFRYNNANNPFIAIRNENTLHIIFIEANFGDIYNHN